MKMAYKSLMLLFVTLVLSGCAACPCKKDAAATLTPVSTETVQTVAAPAVPEVAQESAPVVPEASEAIADDNIPAAVRK